ncbi:MAG: RpiB/LacA/LacB family sugar-phosphate isomerase [Candidatus Brocadiia bacterium]
MRLGIAADHGGFELKERMLERLRREGYEVEDFGAKELDPDDDYPDRTAPVAGAIAEGRLDRGIVICGSGVGACITANKFPGVRAALITETYSARQGVEHDQMNVICLGGRVIGDELAWEIARAFLEAEFSGEERHRRRVGKIRRIEERQA